MKKHKYQIINKQENRLPQFKINNLNIPQAIDLYYSRNWVLLPVNNDKTPAIKIPTSQLPKKYLNKKMEDFFNIGVVLGQNNDWLVDIDIDLDEAVKIAPHFLPETGLISGRKARPKSHWFYRCPMHGSYTFRLNRSGGHGQNQFGHIISLRANRYTILPPGIHPSGDDYVWNSFGQPSSVSDTTLRQAIRKIAIASYYHFIGYDLQRSIQIAKNDRKIKEFKKNVKILQPK